MSDIERRRGSGLTRKQREERAYKLVLATGASGAVAVIGALLLVIGVIDSGIPVFAAILAVIFYVMLRRTLGR